MAALPDIMTAADIKALVDEFYQKVKQDDLLALIFNDAQVDWSAHMPTMYRFWESMLLGAKNYGGAPFPKHAVLPIAQKHFERWLELFIATIDQNFAGPMSEKGKWQAICIADTFAQRMGVLPTRPYSARCMRGPADQNALTARRGFARAGSGARVVL